MTAPFIIFRLDRTTHKINLGIKRRQPAVCCIKTNYDCKYTNI